MLSESFGHDRPGESWMPACAQHPASWFQDEQRPQLPAGSGPKDKGKDLPSFAAIAQFAPWAGVAGRAGRTTSHSWAQIPLHLSLARDLGKAGLSFPICTVEAEMQPTCGRCGEDGSHKALRTAWPAVSKC